jgi:hypothetical protein
MSKEIVEWSRKNQKKSEFSKEELKEMNLKHSEFKSVDDYPIYLWGLNNMREDRKDLDLTIITDHLKELSKEDKDKIYSQLQSEYLSSWSVGQSFGGWSHLNENIKTIIDDEDTWLIVVDFIQHLMREQYDTTLTSVLEELMILVCGIDPNTDCDLQQETTIESMEKEISILKETNKDLNKIIDDYEGRSK